MKQCKEDDLLKSIVDSDDTSSSLQPRDAFYGGRTETFKLYTEASKGNKIKYYDVTSLYHHVNKLAKYLWDTPRS